MIGLYYSIKLDSERTLELRDMSDNTKVIIAKLLYRGIVKEEYFYVRLDHFNKLIAEKLDIKFGDIKK